MKATKTIQLLKTLPFLTLFFMAFISSAQADSGSSATASSQVNWTAISFSSPATPGGGLNSYSEITQAFGSNLSTNQFSGHENNAPGWTAISTTQHFGPQTSATASTNNNKLTTSSTDAGNFQSVAQIDRSGFINSKNGSVTISVPYAFNISITNNTSGPCCYSAFDQVYIELFNSVGNELLDAVQVDQFVTVTNYDKQGMLTLTFGDLPPGSYFFDIGTDSRTTFVPEPASLLLLTAGLLSLAALSFRKPSA